MRGGGGIFKDMAVHDLDMSRFLMGSEPKVWVGWRPWSPGCGRRPCGEEGGRGNRVCCQKMLSGVQVSAGSVGSNVSCIIGGAEQVN